MEQPPERAESPFQGSGGCCMHGMVLIVSVLPVQPEL